MRLGLQSLVPDAGAWATESLPDPSPLGLVGPYRLLRLLGEGGMGVVYLAEQSEPIHRQVALKVIKLGMDREEVIRRFDTERQALAALDAPGIARVLEAGSTPEGRPFFAMEYFPGAPITEFCEAERLDTRQRVELFLEICQAIQHAHRKGVIHRDLKPTNILAACGDDGPVVKVIDFGIARATGDATTLITTSSGLGQLIGTPQYMSPEQARGDSTAVDTRSDVYSLGVVLYELLVGAPPFDAAEFRRGGIEALLRAIRETPAPKPSTRAGARGCPDVDAETLARELRGDLDWIVLKAMEKDLAQRYGAVSELAADLRRYLTDRPVLAGPPSLAYRAKKLFRRHRLGAATAVAVLLAVAVSGVGLTLGLSRAVRAERQALIAEAKATEEAAAAEQVTDFLVGLLREANPGAGDPSLLTVREALDRGVEKATAELDDRPLLRARLLDTIASVYQNLGLYHSAEPLHAQALELSRQQLGPGDLRLGEILFNQGVLYLRTARYDEAEDALAEALTLFERRAGPTNDRVAKTLRHLGVLNRTRGRFDDALRDLERAVEIAEAASGGSGLLSDALDNLASTYLDMGNLDAAEPLYRRSLDIKRTAHGSEHVSVAVGLHNLATLYLSSGRLEDSERMIREAVAINGKVLPAEHPDQGYSLSVLGQVKFRQGRFEDATRHLGEAIETMRLALGPEHPRVGAALISLGNVLTASGEYEDAEAAFREALTSVESSLGPDDADVGAALGGLANVRRRQGRHELALELDRRVEELRRQTLGEDHPHYALALVALAMDHEALDEVELAEPLHRRALEIQEASLGPDHPEVAASLRRLARLSHEQGRHAESAALFARALEIFEDRLGPRHPLIPEILDEYAELLREMGRSDEAEATLARAEKLRQDPSLGG